MGDGRYKNGETWSRLHDKRQLLVAILCHQWGPDATKHNVESTEVAVYLLHTWARTAPNMLCKAIPSCASAADSATHTALSLLDA